MSASEVRLTVPGAPESLRLVRLAAADVGARAGMTYEDIEDLRIAVDECAHVLVDGGGGPLEVVFRLRPGAVEVEGRCPDGLHGVPVEHTRLAQAIVGAVVDGHELGLAGGARMFRLRKRVATPGR